MAKLSTGYTLGVTRQQFLCAMLRSEGHDIDYIAQHAYDCTDGDGSLDPDKFMKAKATVRKNFRNPKVMAAYKEILKEFMADYMGPAIRKVGEQINDPNGWLANKAANDVMSRFYAEVLGEEDKKIVVQVEGMPTLGTPDK